VIGFELKVWLEDTNVGFTLIKVFFSVHYICVVFIITCSGALLRLEYMMLTYFFSTCVAHVESGY